MKFVCPVCGYVEEYDGEELPAGFRVPPVRLPRRPFCQAVR